MLHNAEQQCSFYNQCPNRWPDNDGSYWCFESCRNAEKDVGFNLEGFINMLEQEKYKYADNELKATWNKAIKKAVLLVRANLVK